MPENLLLTKTGVPVGDIAQFNGGVLEIFDPESLAGITRPYLSVSTAKAVDRCPAALAGDRIMAGGFDLMGAAEIGTAAHAVMERLFQLPKIRRDDNHAMSILVDLAREEPASELDVDYARHLGTDPVRYGAWIAAVSRAYSGIFTIEDPRDVDVIETEMRFEGIELDGVPVKGFIDRVDYVEHRGEKVVRIVDFKAGKPRVKKPPPGWSDDHGDQIKAYVEAYEAATGDRPKRGALYYTAPGGGARVVAVSKKETRAVVNALVRSWDTYQGVTNSGQFPTAETPLCGWCPLVNACPTAHAAGREDRTGKAPLLIELGMPDPAHHVPADDPFMDAGRDQTVPPTQDSEPPNQKEPTMSTTPLREGKPFDGPVIDGHANFNSYAAGLVSGVVGLAVEQLHNAGARKTPEAIEALADTFGTVITSAMRKVGGRDDLDLGLATRMHGNLRTMLAIDPIQFDWTTQEWTDWVNRVVRRMVAMTNVTADRIVNGFNSNYPWRALATDPAPIDDTDPADAWDEPVSANH